MKMNRRFSSCEMQHILENFPIFVRQYQKSLALFNRLF